MCIQMALFNSYDPSIHNFATCFTHHKMFHHTARNVHKRMWICVGQSKWTLQDIQLEVTKSILTC